MAGLTTRCLQPGLPVKAGREPKGRPRQLCGAWQQWWANLAGKLYARYSREERG